MKAAAFDYTRADSLGQVLDLLADAGDEARIIAGGQSLVAMMAMRLARPERLVDINHVGELAGITSDSSHVVIKACTRQADALGSELVARELPLLAAALPHVGHVQTRNRGTIGGSLAHGDPTAEIRHPGSACRTSGTVQGAKHSPCAASRAYEGLLRLTFLLQ